MKLLARSDTCYPEAEQEKAQSDHLLRLHDNTLAVVTVHVISPRYALIIVPYALITPDTLGSRLFSAIAAKELFQIKHGT